MTNILEKIYHDKIIEVRERKKHLSLEDICKNVKILLRTAFLMP